MKPAMKDPKARTGNRISVSGRPHEERGEKSRDITGIEGFRDRDPASLTFFKGSRRGGFSS